MATRYAVGLDLGGTNIKAALLDEQGQILCKTSAPTKCERGADAVIADMAGLVGQVIDGGGVDRSAVLGVGIGAPGPLSSIRGLIYESVNLPAFRDVPIRDELARRCRMPAILHNDGNAAAYGEFWVGAGRQVRNLVAFTLGTGVGAGVILSGSLLEGHFENAAELGHMIVERAGRPCRCGQRGCLEQYASATAVARQMTEALARGEPSRLTVRKPDAQPITSQDVADAARQGDPTALRVWEEACTYLAIGCINVQHAFNPALIVLGGGMSAAGDLLLEAVRRKVRESRWSMMEETPELALARLGNDAGIIGAGGFIFAAHPAG